LQVAAIEPLISALGKQVTSIDMTRQDFFSQNIQIKGVSIN